MAMVLNGVDQYALVNGGNIALGGESNVMMIDFKTPSDLSASSDGVIMGIHTSGYEVRGFFLELVDGFLAVVVEDGTQIITFKHSTVLAPSTWYRAIGTLTSADGIYLRINTEASSESVLGSVFATSTQNELTIGRTEHYGNTRRPFKGSLTYAGFVDGGVTSQNRIDFLDNGIKPELIADMTLVNAFNLIDDGNSDDGGTNLTLVNSPIFNGLEPSAGPVATILDVSDGGVIRPNVETTITCESLTAQDTGSKVVIKEGVSGEVVLTITGWDEATGLVTVTGPISNLMHNGTKTLELTDHINGVATFAILFFPPEGYTSLVVGSGSYPTDSWIPYLGLVAGDELILATEATLQDSAEVATVYMTSAGVIVLSSVQVPGNYEIPFDARDFTDGTLSGTLQNLINDGPEVLILPNLPPGTFETLDDYVDLLEIRAIINNLITLIAASDTMDIIMRAGRLPLFIDTVNNAITCNGVVIDYDPALILALETAIKGLPAGIEQQLDVAAAAAADEIGYAVARLS